MPVPNPEKKSHDQSNPEYIQKHSKSGDPTTCNVQTISQILDRLSTSEDASLQLFTLLALFCTLISIFGLYSISSSNMEQRRKEIAIRKVMGASAGTIVKMFLWNI